jgi:hypothetical protein
MPKLLVFAACENVVVDQNNIVSLHSLLENINVQVPPGFIAPPNAGTPIRWFIFSLWQRESSDQGKTFEQRSALVTADGIVVLETPIAVFEIKAPQHRIISQVMGMPISKVGGHLVKTFIREKGDGAWTEAGSYPITINWVDTLTPVVH